MSASGTEPPPAGRLPCLDAVRGLAALGVVLFHLGWMTPLREELVRALPWPLARLIEAGHLGVPVFFVLSGFVIARSLSHQAVDAAYFGRFALRRSLRLDPPYWCAILLAVALTLAGQVLPEAPAAPTLGVIAAHAAYLQGILGMRCLVSQFWTLPQELQFYLVACASVAVEERLRAARAPLASAVAHAPLALVSLACLAWGVQTGGWFLGLWYQFLLGALTCRMIDGRCPRWVWGCALVVVGAAALDGDAATLVTLLAACALLGLAGLTGRLATWGTAIPLQWLGRVSYSLYLTHFVGTTACKVGARLLNPTEWAAVGFLVVALIGTLVAAALFHRLVEAPSLALSRSPHPLRDLRDAIALRRLRPA